jgi:hypothetical protein
VRVNLSLPAWLSFMQDCLDSLRLDSLPLACYVVWCCGRAVRWYVIRDVFDGFMSLIYIHFCLFASLLLFLFGFGGFTVRPALTVAGELAPSVSSGRM